MPHDHDALERFATRVEMLANGEKKGVWKNALDVVEDHLLRHNADARASLQQLSPQIRELLSTIRIDRFVKIIRSVAQGMRAKMKDALKERSPDTHRFDGPTQIF